MDPSVGYGSQVPEPTHCRFHHFHHHNSAPHHHHHHHHHFHVSPNCPFHSYMLNLKNHSPTCPIFAPSYLQSQNPEAVASVPFPGNPLDFQVSQPKETIVNDSLLMHEENTAGMEEEGEHQEDEEEEEEEDPVFVLTDEWREFFAKSEAKRRLAKKQARKKGKKRIEQ